ncbi:hypothetical protein CVT26_001493 [Gymnopilus dilepis]|uniref:Uncharacterized protein n=1 Tax=Gymnopilus dilepis TaxID=231916 RepID=A0A409WB99_9AGAR|nr:hypothetical protein CVT26_001493 [Gymnopilus dilepis]
MSPVPGGAVRSHLTPMPCTHFTPEPKESTKPKPIGSMPMLFLFTTCTLCALFILWKRADALRRVVSHQYVPENISTFVLITSFFDRRLKTFNRSEGRIRLSEDDGPPANEFLADDFDDDNEHLHDSDDEPLTEHIRKATQAWREPNVRDDDDDRDEGDIKILPSGRTNASK